MDECSPAPWIVITGLDGSGKTDLVAALAGARGGFSFRLPYHAFVKENLKISGGGAPFGDVHTDRLLYAADARLTNTLIRRWRGEHSLLVSQRGWMDNFIFGAVQGVDYRECDALLRCGELERPSAIVYLIADPEVGFGRIKFDRDADKFETLAFMREQHRETLRFRDAVRDGGQDALAPFAGIPETLIETTHTTEPDVFRRTRDFLDGVLGPRPGGRDAPDQEPGPGERPAT